MLHAFISAVVAGAVVTTACVLPTDTLSNTITTGFGILIQNPASPLVHNRYFNLLPAGGGDQHLFLSPVGDATFNLVLQQGAIAQGIIHAVIGGEYSEIDNTTKMFMTERGDPRAIYQPTYACNPDNDALQIELVFQTMERQPAGGNICVRVASGNRGMEFRYSPPGNPAFDPSNPCIPVRLVLASGGAPISVSTTSTSTSVSSTSTSSSVSVSTTSTTSSAPVSTPTGPTINGIWNPYGCRTEGSTSRALTSATFASDTMTLEACATFCSSYTYFGTEWARECYCGNTFAAGSVPAPPGDCSFRCAGNNLQFCGAGQRLTVYTRNNVPPPSSPSSTSTSTSISTTSTASNTATGVPPPYTDLTAKNYAFVGCAPEERRATDGPGRTLTGTSTSSDTMTNGNCVDYCAARGFAYAGSEWSRECWCGNTVAPGRQPKTTAASLASCNFKCTGDVTQNCGGDAWLSLYKACPVGGPCVNAVFT